MSNTDERPTKFHTRVGVYGVITRHTEDGDELLVCRVSPGCPDEGIWTLPGGGMDYNESPEETLRREIGEETSLDCIAEPQLRFVYSHPIEPREEPFQVVGIVYDVGEVRGALRNEFHGSTDLCAYVPVVELCGMFITPTVKRVCEELLKVR